MTEKDQELNMAEDMEEVVSQDSPKSSKSNEKRWYIVHTYSGYENKVKSNLEKRIEPSSFKSFISSFIATISSSFSTTLVCNSFTFSNTWSLISVV